MASFSFFLLFITTVVVTYYYSVSSCSAAMVLLPLMHSLSKTQLNSTHHLLKLASTRSATRFQRHRRPQISLPLSPGSDYILSFNLGSQPISLYMDTGSDLVWFPCAPFECILCEGKYESSRGGPSPPPPNITSAAAALVSCKSPACSAAHSSLSSSNLCAIARCPLELIETSDCSSFSCPPFYYAYGDGSLVARLYRHTLSIPASSSSPSSPLILPNFTFGCAHTALGEPLGVAGFGRGLLSLPAQLAAFSPQLGNHFSYCLVSHSFDADRVRRPSPLILGRYDEEQKRVGNGGEGFAYTPMLDNPKHPYFYCVGLQGITVGKRKIPVPEILKRVDRRGQGGMVVDSGTTFTMLPAGLYDSLVTEFNRRIGRVYPRATQIEERTGLGPCYYSASAAKVPALAFHFVGNSTVVLPRNNYYYEFFDGKDGEKEKRKVGCLMLMNGGDEAESGGPASTLGNYQQQGFEVVYDLEKRRVGFARRKCASLWDSLYQR